MTENNHDFDLYVHLYPIMKNEQNDNYKMTIFCLRVIRENDFSKFEIKNFDCIYYIWKTSINWNPCPSQRCRL